MNFSGTNRENPLILSSPLDLSGEPFFHYWNSTVWSIILGGIIAWFLMVWLEGGSQYLYDLTVGQTVNRSVNASEHKYPFYYYVVFLSYGAAPWTFLYVGNLIYGVREKMFKSDLQQLFFIEIWTTFVMLSCFGSKLAVYLVPIFPFMTYLSLMTIQQFQWNKWQAIGASLPGMAVSFILPVYIVTCFYVPEIINPFLIAGSFLLTATGVASVTLVWKNKNIKLSIAAFGTGFLLTAFIVGFAMPQFNSEIGYGQLGREAQKMERQWGTSGVVTYGVWRAQNMDVYFPERLKVYSLEQANLLNSLQNKLLIIRSKDKNNEVIRPLIQNKEQVTVNNKFMLVRIN